MRRFALVLVLVIGLIAAFAGGATWASTPFVDIAGNTHEANIDAIYNAGITSGCDGTHYCPNNNVTRAQMATFIAKLGGIGKGNAPKANGRSPVQVFCGLGALSPRAFTDVPCRGSAVFVDSSQDDGYEPSLAIGADGLPAIAHHSVTTGGLRFTHCETPTCSASTTVTIDSVGNDPSLAFNLDGDPVIAYFDDVNDDLKLARCLNPACTSGTTVKTIESDGDIGRHPSLLISPLDHVNVSYYDATHGDLRFLSCFDDICSGIELPSTPLDTTGNIGDYPSMTIGIDSAIIVSYLDVGSSDLRVLHCVGICGASDANTTPDDKVTLDAAGSVGKGSSMAIGSDGMPVISYFDETNNKVKVIHCEAVNCDAIPTVITLDNAAALKTSIAIGEDGLPVVAYQGDNGRLRLAHCSNKLCTAAMIATLRPTFTSGNAASLGIGIDGQPVVAHRGNGTNFVVSRPTVS